MPNLLMIQSLFRFWRRNAPTENMATSYHEAGHAVICWLFGIEVKYISMAQPRKNSRARVAGDIGYLVPPIVKQILSANFTGSDAIACNTNEIRTCAWIAIAGPVAEQLAMGGVFRENLTEVTADFPHAQKLLDAIGCDNFRNAQTLVQQMLESNWGLVKTLAQQLHPGRYLTGAQVNTILSHAPSAMAPR